MARLHELGIRTIVSLESGDASDEKGAAAKVAQGRWVALEKASAAEAGIAFVSLPLSNAGPNSLETLSDGEVLKLLDQAAGEILRDARTGGVLFHCAAGHDRTGIVAGYLRIKYQHWPVEQAIEEMRRLGHNWVKYSDNGGTESWHEAHSATLPGCWRRRLQARGRWRKSDKDPRSNNLSDLPEVKGAKVKG